VVRVLSFGGLQEKLVTCGRKKRGGEGREGEGGGDLAGVARVLSFDGLQEKLCGKKKIGEDCGGFWWSSGKIITCA
jgi:hypothetical protein